MLSRLGCGVCVCFCDDFTEKYLCQVVDTNLLTKIGLSLFCISIIAAHGWMLPREVEMEVKCKAL